jgi:hypothetical protein
LIPQWVALFPQLGSWIKSSERTDQYNCAAFAAGDETQKWDPFPPGLYFWPPNVPRDYSASVFVLAYSTIGYAVCADDSVDPRYEKIALYTNAHGGVLHVARQLPDGRWTSKLGDEEDIIHAAPQSLASQEYGQPTVFLRREWPR